MEQMVAYLKLTSGEEIISNVRVGTIDGQQSIELNFPTLSYEGEDGNYRLKPWLFTKENIDKEAWIQINPISVMVMGTPVPEIIELYNQLFDMVLSPIIKPTNEEKTHILCRQAN